MATKFDSVRNEYIQFVSEAIGAHFNADVLVTGSQEICIPILNADKDQAYLVLTFKIPKGSRDGEEYDGYAMAEEFRMKCEAKEVKAKERAEAKAKKIERDRKAREAKKKEKEKTE